MGKVFRRSVDTAVRRQTGSLAFSRQRTLLSKGLIAYALLHVVGFTSKNHQRLILRLPAEAGDRSVIAVPIESATGPKRAGISGGIVQQRCLVNVFDQTSPENRRRDTEDDVVCRLGLGKAGLGKAAGSRIRPPRDGIEIFHTTVRIVDIRVSSSVKEKRETCFTHRPVHGYERRNRVSGSVCCRVCHLRIDRGAASANSRLSMAESTASGIEEGAKTGACFNGA